MFWWIWTNLPNDVFASILVWNESYKNNKFIDCDSKILFCLNKICLLTFKDFTIFQAFFWGKTIHKTFKSHSKIHVHSHCIIVLSILHIHAHYHRCKSRILLRFLNKKNSLKFNSNSSLSLYKIPTSITQIIIYSKPSFCMK